MIVIGHKDGSIEKASAIRFTQKTKGLCTHTVIGGEFAVGNDIEQIAFKTLLGSCVAIMFYDKVTKIKAMNHFLLPSSNNSNDDMKYGLYSVEAMLNEMYKLGCNKNNMFAKISGGADIMQLNVSSESIGHRNVEFAKDFCKSEGFQLMSEHTRGEHGRLILLANEFETFIKVTQKSETDSKILLEEKSLQKEITKAPVIKEYVGGVDLFGMEDKSEEPEMEIELF
ncbi:chemotaxis protein CheD [Poseidonibacter ostreae]|uniref:Probable chemoreceptor glutamine deamidase CheD n=1 Tax=Poseidonibacter ostreae TaxID=2654171 RepID=A0A6L4WXZ8_9BACT|nr:chemotaxis protein CheD [Poseidonibacter ostreae]KAB7886812.1 chemotaxis protein CheD [Poseidonibacter ostreae]KAB7888734.1 chemotaxis protein CheD [Poseidonibacter ostreae]KAB7890455.1 chemotaxis protein CheD [Poseidonibacter ostreae]MAC84935.1 chemotaxis protein CheD [Arcobacter sp.]